MIRRSILFSTIVVLASSPLSAQAPDGSSQPPVLWGQLTLGMHKEDVLRLYPSPTIALTGVCSAKLKTAFKHELLTEVVLFVNAAGHCPAIVKGSLLKKYGDPAKETSDNLPGLDKMIEYNRTFWKVGSLQVMFSVGKVLAECSVDYQWVPEGPPESIDATRNL